jgi:hypothetical protein
MAEDNNGKTSFWATIPGIITGIATLITAVGGLLVILNSIGFFRHDGDQTSPKTVTIISVTPSGTKDSSSTPGSIPVKDTQVITVTDTVHLPPTSPAAQNYQFNTFPEALSAVFADAKNNFAKFKGDQEGINYKPKVVLEDRSFEPANIFQYGDEWAFRFTNSGAAKEEINNFTSTEKAIETVFTTNRLKFSRSTLPFKSNKPQSFQYTSGQYRIELTRMITNGRFYHEIIIYHSM